MEKNAEVKSLALLSPVLVTGANGFIGTALCRALVRAGCEVGGVVLQGTDKSLLHRLGVATFEGDILRTESLTEPLSGVKTVFHLAALAKDWGKWSEFMAVILRGTQNVLEAAGLAGVQRFVHMSSLAVHPFTGHVEADESTPATNRINGYCAAKCAAEELVRRFQEPGRFETTIIRPGAMILGPGDFTTFVKLAPYLLKGKLVLIDRGRQLTCYSYVENLADGMLLAAARSEGAGETFILTDDLKITLREILSLVCAALGVPARFRSCPAPAARAAGWALETLWHLARRPNPPPVHRYRVGFAARDFHFSCDKAKRLLGYRPTVPLSEGLGRTVEWYRSLSG